jgi:putative ATPase
MSTRDTDLFAHSAEKAAAKKAPLAERMRPRTLDEYVGQTKLLGPGRLLRQVTERQTLPSLILWGPPGCGKTTLAHLLAQTVQLPFVAFSAVLSGVKELRQIIDEAQEQRRRSGKSTVLFVDEIHRFNKAQQDAFLPHVERGLIILIGATTENPSFEVIAPLLSRTRVVVLEPLSPEDLILVLKRALQDEERGLGIQHLTADEEALAFIVQHAQGDARVALNTLEVAATLAAQKETQHLDLALAEEAAQHKALLYDKGGEEHYNVISAFIKSMRGSDPDAAVYWLMRMLEAGEDPLFIARRMVIFAAEDISNADPHALSLAIAAKDAVHFVGLPEGRIPLAQAATYLATAPKSNASYKAMLSALEDVKKHGPLPVPLPLRNAPTKLMKGLGYGKGYQYAHDYEGAVTEQQHLPDALRERRYYFPSERGQEKEIKERMAERKRQEAGGRRQNPGAGTQSSESRSGEKR